MLLLLGVCGRKPAGRRVLLQLLWQLWQLRLLLLLWVLRLLRLLLELRGQRGRRGWGGLRAVSDLACFSTEPRSPRICLLSSSTLHGFKPRRRLRGQTGRGEPLQMRHGVVRGYRASTTHTSAHVSSVSTTIACASWWKPIDCAMSTGVRRDSETAWSCSDKKGGGGVSAVSLVRAELTLAVSGNAAPALSDGCNTVCCDCDKA